MAPRMVQKGQIERAGNCPKGAKSPAASASQAGLSRYPHFSPIDHNRRSE